MPEFDKDICLRLQEEGRQLMREHPEIRGIAIAIDYYSAYDRPEVEKGVWLCRDGPVPAPDAIIGSLMQVMRLAQDMFESGYRLIRSARSRCRSRTFRE